MSNDDQKPIEIKSVLDKSEIQAELQEVQKIADNHPVKISVELDKEAEKKVSSFFSKVLDKIKDNLVSKVADIGERMQVHTFQNIVKLF
mgnify:CR=1 FL=1